MENMLEMAVQNVLANLSPWLLVPFGLLLVVKILEHRLRGRRRGTRTAWRYSQNTAGRRDMRDPKLQAEAIARVGFVKTPLMNKGEYRVFSILERTSAGLRDGYRVMAQVNLGEFLKPEPQTEVALKEEAFASINSKRVDFLIIDRTGQGALAVEYQGSGHYLGQTAFLRDAVKKEALRRAGIPLLEVTPDMRPDDITAQMKRLLGIGTETLSYT
ncbi:DUF2726 domain-containing protein [Pararhodobacter sp.]|uniref:DUF2726 domain-containing protein n=1 Tax=Pararhodobacter sp. TaxID=2127056 RepID=UPI002AFF8633|nr:DUF2726 domain-containing protein [Pararhodobacter sp.]